ncbi:MAG: pentapeptide repeat-containing protein [Hyphomicrobiales bacterium]
MSQEPDFDAFDDWLVYGPAGLWPSFYRQDRELTVEQKKIVERNAGLLLDREAWSAHVAAFEEQLALIEDEEERSKTRAIFQIRFNDHIFPDNKAKFSDLHFPCSVSFHGATFGGGNVLFNRAVFEDGSVEFDGATFGDGNVSFSGATFGDGYVLFIGATFGKGNVVFSETKFGGEDVFFDNIKLITASIFFSGIDVAGNLFVRGTIFPKEANFQRASVKGTADFSDNTFHEVPDFRDTVFARSPEVARMEVPPPEMEGKRLLKTAKDAEDVSKYRKLKAMALAANDHEKDIEFFAYEMRAKRGREKGSIKWYDLLTNWLYFKVSNFGQSYWRPLACLLISLVVFIAPYFWMVRSFLPTSEAIWFGFGHSWRNFMPLLSSLFRFAARPEGHPSGYDEIFHKLAHDGGPLDLLVYLGIFQNFIGLILLFLLLLGLRNKFRLK